MSKPYEVVIAIPGDRVWCISQQDAIRKRLHESRFDPTALPSVSVHGEPAELLLHWSDLYLNSGWDALCVAHVAGVSVMPELQQMRSFRVRVQAQDPVKPLTLVQQKRSRR